MRRDHCQRGEFIMTDWAIRLHVPTTSFHLGTKGEGRKSKKIAEDRWRDSICLFIWDNFTERGREERKKTWLYFLLYRRDDRFTIAIKLRICNKDPCLIAIEKLKTSGDGNLQWSSSLFPLSGCGRSPNSLWGFNPIKKTIIYVRVVPEESASRLFSITQT